MHRDFFTGRHAGLLVPLFSCPSRRSWGIGEIGDLPRLGRWLEAAGFSFVLLLPLNEMADGQQSPYSALSAMAIDPIFISPADVPEFAALGGEASLDAEDSATLAAVRASSLIDYSVIRPLKNRALRAAFNHFAEHEWQHNTARAVQMRAFAEAERWWLEDYVLFRAIHARNGGRYWREWYGPLRDRDPRVLRDARQDLAEEVLYYAYLQWVAAEQWSAARAACPVGLFGDFPFMVSGDSADVWSRQEDFRLDASVGAPPDAFSETGQDWGFPAYRWSVIAAGGYQWLADRARRGAELYDGFRVDHLVGFFRTYAREAAGDAAFDPADEPAQLAQGSAVLEVLRRPGARLIAEDLGVIPPFVRETLARMSIPGYKVLRWERDWNTPGQPFVDPGAYAACSVATSGTHDTETLAEWWDVAPAEERGALAALARDGGCDPASAFAPPVRDALLDILYRSAADIVLLPIQDVFGWRDRINTPAVVNSRNWTWRLPWPVEDLALVAEAHDRAAHLRALAERCART
jgi:4-alpha-glucanotransferase